MKKLSRKIKAALCSVAVAAAVLLFALGITVANAKEEKNRYASAEAYLARCDLAEAAAELREAVSGPVMGNIKSESSTAAVHFSLPL